MLSITFILHTVSYITCLDKINGTCEFYHFLALSCSYTLFNTLFVKQFNISLSGLTFYYYYYFCNPLLSWTCEIRQHNSRAFLLRDTCNLSGVSYGLVLSTSYLICCYRTLIALQWIRHYVHYEDTLTNTILNIFSFRL